MWWTAPGEDWLGEEPRLFHRDQAPPGSGEGPGPARLAAAVLDAQPDRPPRRPASFVIVAPPVPKGASRVGGV